MDGQHGSLGMSWKKEEMSAQVRQVEGFRRGIHGREEEGRLLAEQRKRIPIEETDKRNERTLAMSEVIFFCVSKCTHPTCVSYVATVARL